MTYFSFEWIFSILPEIQWKKEYEVSKRRYDAKNRPDNNEIAAHIHKLQPGFDRDIEVLILKGNLHQNHEREL